MWAYSTSGDGARSPANHQFLDGLLHRGSLAATPGMTISVDQTAERGVPCIALHFYLPQVYRSTAVESIPIVVPTVCVGTGTYQPIEIFYALIEEIIGWLAHVGPKDTLLRLYRQRHGQPPTRPYSLNWQQLHSGFSLFIRRLRQPSSPFPGLGQISGSFGLIEVWQARTSSGDVSEDYVVTLTLDNGQCMSLFLPRSVAQLGTDWLLDWLEVQNEFSFRGQ